MMVVQTLDTPKWHTEWVVFHYLEERGIFVFYCGLYFLRNKITPRQWEFKSSAFSVGKAFQTFSVLHKSLRLSYAFQLARIALSVLRPLSHYRVCALHTKLTLSLLPLLEKRAHMASADLEGMRAFVQKPADGWWTENVTSTTALPKQYLHISGISFPPYFCFCVTNKKQ